MRDGASYLGPKLRAVVKVFEMAELVHHHIVGKGWRQERDLIIEVKVAKLRAAAPARAAVFNCHPLNFKLVELVKIREPRVHNGSRGFFIA